MRVTGRWALSCAFVIFAQTACHNAAARTLPFVRWAIRDRTSAPAQMPSPNPPTTIGKALAPGTYTVVVEDRSSVDNFHLGGPDIDEQTTLEFVGTVTWTLNFTPGGYSYRTDGAGAPACGCNQTFSVRQPAPAQLRGTVAANSISLKTPAGARAANLAAGRYVIVVNDRSRGNNFHLSGKGVNRRTGVNFVGRKTWTITLAPGSLYTYRSDSNPSMRRAFRTLD